MTERKVQSKGSEYIHREYSRGGICGLGESSIMVCTQERRWVCLYLVVCGPIEACINLAFLLVLWDSGKVVCIHA